ncbi:NAD(P)H-binding protein [Streptomyces palmae]|uniref:NAD-dependent epimerase/dehydratase family protein n=1 Tax=Streptomyces palmae TaxID=1701085 RepID=A0A4Z0HF60_9ACTN|nr:NAD(P)H-binding protein [Streptomyces palmae]TGB13899.1 NAD-dependent epimerase/dehydratase family protein [Streptomyces palmae]
MIVVTGATGNVGRHVVRELAESGVRVCALSRDPANARVPAGVQVARAGDLPMCDVRAVFLNPAVIWQDGPEAFLRQAGWHGVRRVVTLSSSSAAAPGPDNPIGTHHRELEAAIEESGLEWTHLRPGAFAANAAMWAAQVRAGDLVHGPYAEARSAPVHEADIAAVGVRALLGDELLGRTPVLTGPEPVTHAEQVRLIGEAVGRPLRYVEITPEEALERMTGGHLTRELASSLLRIYADSVDGPVEVSPEIERITGRPARSFATWARERGPELFG